MIGIYKITSPSGRIYIGQSVDLEKRGRAYSLLSNCKRQVRLYSSLVKYGFSEHIFEVVEECVVEDLNVRERYWQDFYDVISEEGLNCKLTKTGDRSGKHSEESKRKMRGLKRSEEGRDNMKKNHKGMLGKKHSEETIGRIREANRGLKRSEEARRNNSEGQKGKKFSEETKRRLSEALRAYWENKKKNKVGL